MSKFASVFLALGLGWSAAFASEIPLYHVGNRLAPPSSADPYLNKIQPILSSRCVSCHGCYEAPCQLNLESYEGLRRGFNPVSIFSGSRLGEMKPTRRIDGPSVDDWRARGFHAVVNATGEFPEDENERVEDSLFSKMLSQSAANNAPGFSLAPLAKLQEKVLDANPQCVASTKQWNSHFTRRGNNAWSVKQVDTYLSENPTAGMPFALPKLEDTSLTALTQWLAQGAHGPSKAASEANERPSRPEIVATWESFLNGDSAKEQQTARYIYEHVFTAHLHFDESPGEFYELVRSRTASGPIEVIATALPYDRPGVDRVYHPMGVPPALPGRQ